MAKQESAAAPNQINIIAEGTVFEGTLQAETDVRVSGRIIGKLKVQGRAVVAPEGAVEGEVSATNANIAGTIKGDMIVQERLMLGSSARVEGTIKTTRLIVEEGATFNGECQMGQPGQIRKKAGMPQEATQPPRAEVPREDRPEAGASGDKPRPVSGSGDKLSPKF